MVIRFCILSIPLLLSIGCQSTKPIPDTPRNAAPPQIEANLLRIDKLLGEAEQALAKQRLTTPVDDNAYLRYLQVLAIDKNNQEAEAGIARIVETYLGWAVEAIDQFQFTRAADMLNKANSLNDAHPALETLRERITTERSRETQSFRISQQEIVRKDQNLTNRLAEIAKTSEYRRAMVRISARSDADARWIYQQMNLATESRIRATIHSGRSPSVQLIFP